MCKLFLMTLIALTFPNFVFAVQEFTDHTSLMDHGDGHLMDMDGGMVMGQNINTLPGGCSKIAAEKEITVHAGHKYAKKFPGKMFAFDKQEYQFEPCTKLTVNFVNDDNIRHQWMMHGLPKYLYTKGMFHLEVTGPGKISGSLIFPPNDKTYLVHCDISQHMEKGMKAQVKIGSGSGDLPSIPGITANVIQDDYSDSIPDTKIESTDKKSKLKADNNDANNYFTSWIMLIGLSTGLLLTSIWAHRFKDVPSGEAITIVFTFFIKNTNMLIKLISNLGRSIFVKKIVKPKT